MNKTLAVLITCHNRRIKTLSCLSNFFNAITPSDLKTVDVFLVDDGSTDGTSEAVEKNFPDVNIIKGSGKLFWNQGMRLAWRTASARREYDFYLWLNDDVLLDKKGLISLFECYAESLANYKMESIITGACKESEKNNTFSYGGRTELGNVIPNGKLQQCKLINGNVVLVPKKIFEELGYLSSDYTHSMGDFDYGLRAINSGFLNFTTKEYIAICPTNGIPKWSNPKLSIKERFKLFYAPTGLSFKEYIAFRKKFWGNKWILFAFKAYFRVLFPSLYNILKKST